MVYQTLKYYFITVKYEHKWDITEYDGQSHLFRTCFSQSHESLCNTNILFSFFFLLLDVNSPRIASLDANVSHSLSYNWCCSVKISEVWWKFWEFPRSDFQLGSHLGIG